MHDGTSSPFSACHNGTLIVTADAQSAARVIEARLNDIPYLREISVAYDAGPALSSLLDAIPVVRKADLIEHGLRAMIARGRSVRLLSETSGTSGSKPLLTPRGLEDFSWNSQNQAASYSRHMSAGQDRIILLNPSVMSPFIEASARALFDLGIPAARMFPIEGVCDYARIARVASDYEITAVMTTPALALKLLYEFARMQVSLPALSKILLTGEPVHRTLCNNIDRLMSVSGAARSLIYGSSEAASVMYGVSPGLYRGFLNDFMFELIPLPAETSCEHSDGVYRGELVITWLRDGPLPLVRYATGDECLARFNKGIGDWLFEPLGRREPILGGETATSLDNVFFDRDFPVHDYSVSVKSERVNARVVYGPPGHAVPAFDTALRTGLEEFFGRETHLISNAKDDRFYGFRPAVKAKRVAEIS